MHKDALVLVERPPFLLQTGKLGRAKTPEVKPADRMPQLVDGRIGVRRRQHVKRKMVKSPLKTREFFLRLELNGKVRWGHSY
ncbi:MAG TPA: hypothetical protein VGO57_07425 [Verrucomicrobiae bacterium]